MVVSMPLENPCDGERAALRCEIERLNGWHLATGMQRTVIPKMVEVREDERKESRSESRSSIRETQMGKEVGPRP